MLRSTRTRVAALATVAALLALGGGGLWFVRTLSERFEAGATQLASAEAQSITRLLDDGTAPADVTSVLRGSGVPLFEIVDHTGRVASCPELDPTAPPFLAGRTTLTLDGPVTGSRISWQRCNSGFDGYIDGPIRTAVVRGGTSDYAVYVAARIDPYDQLPAIRSQVLVAVPVVALAIGIVAWLAVRRSLRPVERIRSGLAEISAHDLTRRVPVPATRDELAALATTTNETLTRLRSAVERQRRFTADASHELRTPLASLRTQLEVLLAYPDRIDWQEAVTGAVADVGRLQELVADLLTLARLEGGGADRQERVPMAEVVSGCLAGRDVAARLMAAVVRGHRGQLARVVRNLLDNAERHARSTVTVSLTVTDECVLEVSDDGPGVPTAERERVFDPFVRLDEDRDREDGGSGLGLAIVSEIITAHGGTVSVLDNEPGARFVVRLPLA
ncbi:signal transduction histidine kinase [Amycolatopsis bartoniae]|uniref:histidine kinase n=1 Tax=Amycolatopsis bartoniae TaxID=941986 RepID=A0A8H9IV61_9PSEU|nr:HAMP domain-containing sensor histidine kinase [Amycolatopsis bartoniae]MBB2934456.1 signal transduction histidine kinase [Amycolatopsis bartoniae]TVT02190.1 HAMP domain-containing histidine kinase [Amycolatopsis bartoniae]GHF47251.1 two-component sensor histidine kinase [Amycolatopsis bartoniae]